MGIPWGALRRQLDMWSGLEVGLWVLWWMDGIGKARRGQGAE